MVSITRQSANGTCVVSGLWSHAGTVVDWVARKAVFWFNDLLTDCLIPVQWKFTPWCASNIFFLPSIDLIRLQHQKWIRTCEEVSIGIGTSAPIKSCQTNLSGQNVESGYLASTLGMQVPNFSYFTLTEGANLKHVQYIGVESSSVDTGTRQSQASIYFLAICHKNILVTILNLRMTWGHNSCFVLLWWRCPLMFEDFGQQRCDNSRFGAISF